jgi:ASC-1-like (ASCH) protein
MSSNHSIHLREEYLELIRNGAKTIEGRINRTLYSDINQGDTVR